MKRMTSKKLFVSVLAIATCCVFCGGAMALKNTFADESSLSTDVFEMQGASVRKVEPSGIRFATVVSKSVYDSYTNPVCGTLIIPTDVLGAEELTLNTTDVANIETKSWQQFGEGYDEYKYTGVLIGEVITNEETVSYTGLPSEYWNVSFASVGYIYESGDTENVRYTNKTVRSLAQTAAFALASGEEEGDLTFLEQICDTVIGDGLSFTDTAIDTYLGGDASATLNMANRLTGNQGLQAIWTSENETVATVDANGTVTLLGEGTTKITATIGTKTAECTVKVGNIKYDETSGLVSWTSVEDATSYKLTVRRYQQSGNDFEFTITTTEQKVYLKEGINLITVKAFNGETELCTRAITYEVVTPIGQKFGQLKAGTANEYYIAEWSNPVAWGQFSSSGYSNGPDGGVTFTTGSWKVYTGGDMHTRIKEGYLHVFSTGGWGDGRLIFHLPQALTVSELESISFKLKFVTTEGNSWSNDGKARFYFSGSSVYIDGSKEANATITQDGEWAIYTISADVLSANGVTSIADFSISSNSGYEMDIQEVTYKAIIPEPEPDPTQKFGQLKAGTENEYYIAEWSNPVEWGQFSGSGYLGGPEGGVTFTTGSWKVYTGGDMHTRIKEGYLHVYATGGWGDGRLQFNLPQTLNVSELGSISFKLKFVTTEGDSWSNDGKARFYINGTSVYVDGSNAANATITQDGEWSIYTISAGVLSANKLTSIANISISSNNGYEMDIQEVTYKAIISEPEPEPDPTQKFGQLKAGTKYEYYIAEWSNLAVWGQFSSSGYLGGPEGGVTFTTGGWKVYTGGDLHTRIKEGYLHVYATGGWGDGRLQFNLPQTLNVSELGSISFKLKFVTTEGNSWSNDGKARFYFSGTSVYIDGSNATKATIMEDGEWSIYTISADVLSTSGVTSITDFSVSSNSGYEMDIQEVTYTMKPTQKFGELKEGTENEYYVAEWSNLDVWGTIAYDWSANKNTYTGGPENGVSLDVSRTRAETKFVDDTLFVQTDGGWANGSLGLILPEGGISLSEISSLTFTLKFADESQQAKFYFNTNNQNYIGGGYTTSTDAEGWTTYTIDVASLTNLGLTDITAIYITTTAGYQMYVKEVTYTK